MKPLPPPPVPGNTEWERFDNAVGMLLNAPKQAFVKQEKKLAKRREKKRAASAPQHIDSDFNAFVENLNRNALKS